MVCGPHFLRLMLIQDGSSNTVKDLFSPSEVKEWVMDDLQKTVSWLESQEEKVGFCLISS